MKNIKKFLDFAKTLTPPSSKDDLKSIIVNQFNLTKTDTSLYCCDDFTVRFCEQKTKGDMTGAVVGLRKIIKHDTRPFLVCLLNSYEKKIQIYLANTSFINKISHSSQEVTLDWANNSDKIRGTVTGSNIIKSSCGLDNNIDNIIELYNLHLKNTLKDNLKRIVDLTCSIIARKEKFIVTNKKSILNSVADTINFLKSNNFRILKEELDNKVSSVSKEITMAFKISNPKTRGDYIEFLITSNNNSKKDEVIKNLKSGKTQELDMKNDLGDFCKFFGETKIEIDIKTKRLARISTPKLFDIDKMLSFLEEPNSVFLFYFIGINKQEIVYTSLTSCFQKTLMSSYRKTKKWAGRKRRGHVQCDGGVIKELTHSQDNEIDVEKSEEEIERLINF